MAYNNGNQGSNNGYDKTKDLVIFKGSIKSEKRYMNVEVYSYDGRPASIRIKQNVKTEPKPENGNRNWIPAKGITQITKEEAEALIRELQNAIKEL